MFQGGIDLGLRPRQGMVCVLALNFVLLVGKSVVLGIDRVLLLPLYLYNMKRLAKGI